MIRTPRARTVLTKSELQLFSSSFAAPVKALSPAKLKAATARARELRHAAITAYTRSNEINEALQKRLVEEPR